MAPFDSNTSSTASPFGNSSPFLNPFQKLPTTTETNLVVDSNGSNLSRSTQFDGRIADNSLFNAMEAGVFSATQASPLVSTSPLFAPLSKPMFERTAQPFRYSASTVNPFRKSLPFLNPFNKLPTPTETSLVVDNNGSNHLGSTPFDGKIAGSSLFNGPVTGIFGATHAPPLVSTSPVFSPLSKPMFERTTPPFGRSASIASPFGKSSPFVKPRDKLTTTNLVVDGKTVASPVLNERASSVVSATQASPFIFSSSAFVPLSNRLFERNTKPFGCSGAMAVGTSGSTALVQKQKQFGSRTVSYAMTNHTENCVEKGMQMFNLKSINAMPVYKTKSAEELRWEDYKSGDKGGLFRYSEAWTNIVPPFEIGSTISAGLSSTNIPHFNTSSRCFSSPTRSSPIFTSSTSGSFATSSQLKDTPSWALENGRTFPSSTHGPSNNSLLSVHNSHVFSGSSWVSTSTPCLGLTSCKTNLALNVSPAITSFVPSTPLEFTQFRSGTFISSPFVFSSQSGSNTSLFSASLPFQTVASPETKPSALSSFKLSVSEHSTEAACSFQGLGPSTAAVSRNTSGLSPIPDISTQKNATTNPFGILPPLPQVPLLSNAKATLSVQYGISNLHVAHKPSPSWRKTSLIPCGARQTSKIHVKVRRYLSKTDTPKVSFFSDEDDALRPNHSFVLRENPRSLFIQQTEKASTTHPINSDDLTLSVEMNDKGHIQTSLSPEKEHMNPSVALVKSHEKILAFINDINPITEDKTREEDDIAAYNDHYTDIKASILPMLRHQDYYIEPTLSELVAKEREDSGYCSRVKDFVVGREGYGFVKFLDETDVRGLDLETIIQFKNCEVAVYLDETKKPPIGMGLNKAAEITLLNVICIDKKTAEPFTYGAELEIFEKRLRRKSEEQGAEFISYNARKGEWKFSVMHFSSYSFYEPQIKASNLCP